MTLESEKKFSKNPLVTLIVFTYNQEKYIQEAVKSALAQTYSPLEIIISDDSSSDSTFEKIKETVFSVSCHHSIKLNCNPTNLGLAAHVNKILEKANGEIIAFAAGDDISLPDRIERTVALLTENPAASFVTFKAIKIDSSGKIIPEECSSPTAKFRSLSLEDYISSPLNFISGASRGFRRSVFDFFGPLDEKCPTEDSTFNIRGFLLGHSIASLEPGIFYRIHEANLSGPRKLNLMAFEEIKNQIIKDANVALIKGLISNKTASRIHEWATKDLTRRKLSAFLYHKKTNPLLCAHRLIFTKGITVREKIRFFARLYFS